MDSQNSPSSDFSPSWSTLPPGAIETIAALAALLALDHLVLHGVMATLNPHPFWIVVLFAAFQYGAWGGAFAAMTASLALYAGGLPPRGDEEFFQYAAAVLTIPATWLLAGVAFGGLRSLHMQKTRALETRLDQAISHAKAIAAGFTRACDEIKRLETRIVADTATVDTIIRDVAAIGAARVDATHDQLALFAQHCLGTTNVTIWLFSPNGADDTRDDMLSGIELSHDVMSTLFDRKRAAVITGLPDDIAVAAPIVACDDVRGLVVVWRIDDLGSEDAARLGRRAELLGRALGGLLETPATPSPVVPLHAGLKRVSSAS